MRLDGRVALVTGAAWGVGRVRMGLGPIDVLVNNAGIVDNVAPFGHMIHEAWARELAVNPSGVFNIVNESRAGWLPGRGAESSTSRGWGPAAGSTIKSAMPPARRGCSG